MGDDGRDRERTDEEPDRPARRPIKVTDRRRVRADDVPAADAASGPAPGVPAEASEELAPRPDDERGP